MPLRNESPVFRTFSGNRVSAVTERFKDALDGQLGNDIDGQILNVRPDPVDFRDRYYEPALIPLPSVCYPRPLSTMGLGVRNQGPEGSCTGQALAAVIDIQNIGRRKEGADVPPIVSSRMLYEMARCFDEYPDDGLPGSSVRGAIKGFYHNGVCGGDLAPYEPGEMGWELTIERAKDARRVGLGAYYRLLHIVNHYHTAIQEAGAIFCSAMVHEGWQEQNVAASPRRARDSGPNERVLSQSAGSIKLPAQVHKARLVGAHAFAIVGYDALGFIVLNSWGPGWGQFNPRQAAESWREFVSRKGGGSGMIAASGDELADRLPGMARWTYEDWRAHVLDAWVLRLSVASSQAFNLSGGYLRRRQNSPAGETAKQQSVSTPRIEVNGHYIHLKDGALVGGTAYPSSLASVGETANYLQQQDGWEDDRRYDHLVFYAHGGLNDLTAAAARMSAMVKGFKRNRIYPVFFLWNTGFLEAAGDALEGLWARARFPETVCCATDRIDGGRAWTGRMGWKRV